MDYKKNSSAIGVFDSGVGGLTILHDLVRAFPNEHFIYLGDTARLPYGNKSPEVIRRYTEEALRFLHSLKCKAIVIACNSASAQFDSDSFQDLPVYTMIQPTAQAAIEKTESGKIGVIGTRATIQSQAYQKMIFKLAEHRKEVVVHSEPAPLFVPLVEEGWTDDPITNLIAFRYLQPLLQKGIDTLILGCTHYPLLSRAIQRICTNSVTLIESGSALVQVIEKDILSGKFQISNLEKSEEPIQLLATDSSLRIEAFAHDLLSQIHSEIQIQPLRQVQL